jgi:3-deoxy-D-manno-octulosonic-acid transferase
VDGILAPVTPTVTIRDVYDWFIWGALIAGGVTLALATARLVTQMLRTWRDFKRVRRHLVRELDRVATSAEAAVEKMAATETRTHRLEQSLGRLNMSIARLRVLTDAIDEVDATFGRAAWFFPRK